jgi:acetoin:2,6-dichlorophenolindophenol oxidoreductase subunit alpha
MPVDGDDVVAVSRTAGNAVERARAGGGPTFLECRTTRWRGHHEGEESYAKPYRRPVEAVDPIDRLEHALQAAGIDAARLRASVEAEERAAVEGALAAAEAEPEPPLERAFEDVFA